jgi:hypothetical protein
MPPKNEPSPGRAAAVPDGASPESSGDVHIGRSKFDLGGPAPAIDVGELPWGYGEDRITATVRDPDSAYLYWEITDDAISTARARLGPAGADGWCSLRVYDTTGRDFDGTNANDYFDVRIDRTDREYFLMIRRPTSTIHVEIGIKTIEGYFQAITRSGSADFPRNDPSPNTRLEWMTVTSDGGAPPAASPCRSRFGGPEPPLPGRAGAGYVDVWRAGYAPTMPQEAPAQSRAHASSSGAAVHRTIERSAQIERWWHLDEWRAEWRGGMRFIRSEGLSGEPESMTWHEGPFPLEPRDPDRVVIQLLGEAPARLKAVGVAFTVYGPWLFTIHGRGARPSRRVLGTWSVHWVLAITPMIERWGWGLERRRLAAFEREHVALGASERLALLERGASELWRGGGSERVWLGASEWAMRGGSETLFLAASQLAGASALWAYGASERMGASERIGASEHAPARPGSAERWASRPDSWGGR